MSPDIQTPIFLFKTLKNSILGMLEKSLTF